MRDILTIIKKEFARFFKDTRLMLTALILPGVLIYALYSIMGSITESIENSAAEEKAVVYVQNMPDELSESLNAIFDVKTSQSEDDGIAKIKAEEADLFVVFPQTLDMSGNPDNANEVSVFYNSSSSKSMDGYYAVTAVLDSFESKHFNMFNVNAGKDVAYDLADSQSTSRMILSMVVPMVLLMLLFSGCMAVAPESIAGEKERGTIATILVTPVKRSSVAIGKIAALSVIALLSGLSSTLGLVLSLPKLAGGASSGMSLSMYGFGDYMAILAVVLSTVLIMVALISIISAYAKSVKEASGLVVPVMILVLLCGVFSMFASGLSSIGLFFIPVFNSALVISTVLSGAVSGAAIAVTVCTNIAFAALLVFFLTLMFKSERIMFNR